MRNLKKFLALVLAMMMTLSLMVTVNAATDSDFTDKDSITENFAEGIEVLKGMGVFEGYPDGSFGPKGEITRAETAAIVYRLATGDWEGTQAHLYKDYQQFDDVASSQWFAGYINYCANAEWIAGYGNGKFGPNDKVTAYQAAAMILRAVGYGKNGEFVGSTWRTQVANVTRSEGLLVNVDKTTYANTMNNFATRELVAEILFQAANIPTVTWTMLNGYNKYTTDLTIAGVARQYRPSLGYMNYGLTYDTGIVLGNQATGEGNTLVGFISETWAAADGGNGNEFIKNGNGSYAYESTADTNITVPFDCKTGLDMFGHKAKVWYDGRTNASGYSIDANNMVEQGANKTYAIFDKAVLSAYVYAEDGDLSVTGAGNGATDALLGAAAIDAGFSAKRGTTANGANGANTSAALSAVYARIDHTKAVTTATATAFGDESPVNMYYLVSNNNGKTVDVAVSLSAEVGVITEKNTTAATQYLTLGTNADNDSEFNNGTAGKIHLKNLTPDSVQTIGTMVTAWQVQGTTAATPPAADYLYQLDAMKTVTKQVSSFTAPTGAGALQLDSTSKDSITEVNFTDGSSMKLSGITVGDQTNSKIISRALPIVINANDTDVNTLNTANAGHAINLKAGVSYTVYEDVLGRFISMTTGSGTSFLYGTFADFEMGALGAGTNKYAITGVDADGKIVANHNLTAVYVDATKTMTKIEGNVDSTYNALTVTKKNYTSHSNQIEEGANTGYMIDEDGQLSPYTGDKMLTTEKWTISSAEVAMGVSRVVSDSKDYLLTENTQFYVVEGSGTATLKVTPYKGIKAFLGNSSSAEIAFTTGDDEVVFWTEEDLYGTTATGKNHHVAKVILSDTNLTRWNSQNLFFSFEADTTGTGLVLPGAGADVKQFKLYSDGKADYYFIDTAAALGGATSMTAETFYTLMPCDEVNGQTVYKAVAQTSAANLSYMEGFNTGVTYNYIAVNNLNFANLTKGTGDLIFNVGNAKICDVQFKEDSTQADSRNEITTLAELNNAISVKNTDPATPVYGVEVAVVYDNNNVALIYITDVT